MINLNNQYLYAKGTCDVVVRNISTGDVEYQSNKVQTSQFTTTCDMGAIQAGIGNTTAINIPHNSAVNLTLTNADFSMEARAMQVGAGIAYSGIGPVCETLTGTEGVLTVSNVPAAPYGYTEAICNVVPLGAKNAAGTAYVIDTTTKAVQGFTAAAGTTYVVTYFSAAAGNKYFNISSVFSPAIKHVTVQIAVYSASAGTSALQGTKVGDLYIIIPRMQFSGKADTDGSQTAAVTTDLSGTALTYDQAVEAGACDCAATSGLAQVIYVPAANTTADVLGLVIVGGEIALTAGDTALVPVKYLMRNNTLANPDYSALTYSIPAGGQSYAEVSDAGVITAKAEGATEITVSMTDPALSVVANVTVAAAGN